MATTTKVINRIQTIRRVPYFTETKNELAKEVFILRNAEYPLDIIKLNTKAELQRQVEGLRTLDKQCNS